jgi:hypothetical protein
MNRFSIINTLQKQVNDLQEQVSFLEFYLREAMATAEMAPPRPAPTTPARPSPFPPPSPTTPPVPRPLYRAGQQAGSQSGTFSPGGFQQTARKRGMQGFQPSYSPGSQSSQQSPQTKPPPVATGRRRRS